MKIKRIVGRQLVETDVNVEALKNDRADGKPRMELVAPDFLRGLAAVLTYGAAKYEPWNWTKGKTLSRDFAAALRHLTAWNDGEDLDPESGLPHLMHAVADIMIVFVTQLRGTGTDDRHRWA